MTSGGQKVIHVGFFEAQIDDVYFPQHEVIGCLGANMASLAEMVNTRN